MKILKNFFLFCVAAATGFASTINNVSAAESTGTFDDPQLRVDDRGNVFIRQPNTVIPPERFHAAKLENCSGLTIEKHSGYGGYYITNAIGDGVTVEGEVNDFHILGASGDGLVVKGNKTSNLFGVVTGTKGAAIVINGDDNTVSDVVIGDDCAQIFVVNGSRNVINYAIAPIKSGRPVNDFGSHMRVKQAAQNI